LLELWQGLIPTRQADAVDFLADLLGALLVAAVLWRWAAPRENRLADRGAASGRKLAQRRSEP
jgi:VanZ family protein